MESALRILHVVDGMNQSEVGIMIMNVYRNLDRNKVQFDFLTSEEGEYDEEILQLGGYIYRISSINEVGIIGYQKALRRFFKGHRFYIVMHSHIDQMSVFPLKAAKRTGIPVRVAHSHKTKSEATGKVKWFKEMAGSLIPVYATDYFACSSEAAEWLFKSRGKQAEIMFKGIELDRFCYSHSLREQGRRELNIIDKEFVIGHFGRFTPQKNYDYLIELFVGFRRRIPQSKLILVGDGPLKAEIEAKIMHYHIQNHVILLEAKEDMKKWLQVFDLFVFPSLQEGLPLTLVEAQGAGLPIIASDCISKEVDLGAGLVQFISLANKSKWLETMYDVYNHQSRNPIEPEILIKKGYDVKQVAQQTQQKYLQLRDDGI
ncbi:Glycosyltransferase involved in cell wall bisynthesis [Gracilibacillus orientalis]|uniref:Glycosyltransferase involved in cell wall bisynthesis n=1 Tax=Gracilibacillus orientalis TaxID=334253 RepID=A0A1I4IJT0_9BACI|nr:glycosyltransferase [Gracilibacillus orientalis]SFL54622.1 Glycosyltransferase involved in cell wall bisynthesis [Gracilibacillus orientalis]